MNFPRSFVAILFIFSLSNLVGCASITSGLNSFNEAMEKVNESDYQDKYNRNLPSAQDSLMYKQFAAPSAFPEYKDISAWYVSLKSTNFDKASVNFAGGLDTLRNNKLQFDPASDGIGRAYVQAAQSRGGIVKMYKPEINAKIAALVANQIEQSSRSSRYNDWDNVLIEYNNSGRMVSALARHNRTSVHAGTAFLDLFSFVVYGDGIKAFEQRIGNRELDNYFIQQI